MSKNVLRQVEVTSPAIQSMSSSRLVIKDLHVLFRNQRL
jgi:hypothetical protein